MAEAADRSVALLSIHPRFADAIMEGRKTVEFRRSVVPTRASHVVIYATAPTQAIVAYFEIASIEKDSPERLWDAYGAAGAISREDFDRYYAGAAEGNAILIQGVRPVRPIRLIDVDPGLTPPQSMCYLRPAAADSLMGRPD